MALRVTYRENREEFGALMMSGQTQDLASDGAERGAAYARLYARGAKLPTDYVSSISAQVGPPVTLGKGAYANPRRTARVVADHRLGATFEFGSGQGSTSGPKGRKRPQGGYSEPYRILGRAGARAGSPPGKRRKKAKD